MKKLKLKDFKFEIDKEETNFVHNGKTPATVECGCGNCRYFNTHRKRFFPKKVIDVLSKFGLDFYNEDYFSQYDTQGASAYQIAYYVKGKIVNQKKDSLAITPDISLIFKDKDLPTNFLPKGLEPPYFELTVWISKAE